MPRSVMIEVRDRTLGGQLSVKLRISREVLWERN
jgi:hypothetical protein